jgi:alpha-D-ribose 1-methylphosphonate 5-triphosphate synthase subunit PhnL
MRRDDAPAAPVLRVERLHKRFTLHLRGGAELQVLHDVSLDVAAGECVALVGPSGQGKSTLIKCLYGNYGIDSGAAWLQSRRGAIELGAASPQQLRELRRSDIAYVSQFLRALPRVSALDIVAERALEAQDDDHGDDEIEDLDAEPAGADAAREAAAALLSRLNLPRPLWSLPPATFSGGEQQRVNIARGLVVPSRLLLLDEPTASLDAANRRVVIGLIEQARDRGAAVVGIFHDEEVRAAVATRCVRLTESGVHDET